MSADCQGASGNGAAIGRMAAGSVRRNPAASTPANRVGSSVDEQQLFQKLVGRSFGEHSRGGLPQVRVPRPSNSHDRFIGDWSGVEKGERRLEGYLRIGVGQSRCECWGCLIVCREEFVQRTNGLESDGTLGIAGQP